MRSLIQEFAAYMGSRKIWWLLPALVILAGLGGLIILAQGSAIGPLIYSVF